MTNKNPFKINLQPELFAMFEALDIIKPINNIVPFYYRGIATGMPIVSGEGYIIKEFSFVLANETLAGSITLNTLTSSFVLRADQIYTAAGGKFKNQTTTNYLSTIGVSANTNIGFIIAIGFKTFFKP